MSVIETGYWIRNTIFPIPRKFFVSKVQDPKLIRGRILDSEHDFFPTRCKFLVLKIQDPKFIRDPILDSERDFFSNFSFENISV